MARSVAAEFVQGQYLDNLIIATSAEDLLSRFARHYENPPNHIDKWTDR